MRKAVKRIFVLLLCVTLLVEGNVTHAFCAEVEDTNKSYEDLVENQQEDYNLGKSLEEPLVDNNSDIGDEADISENSEEQERSETTNNDVGDNENQGEQVSEDDSTIDESVQSTEEEITESEEVEDIGDENLSSNIGDEPGEEIFLESGEYIPYSDATYSLKYSVDGKNITITGYSGTASGDLVIPSSISGKKVIAIDNYAFENAKGFDGNLVIPNGIQSIGYYAFYGCTGLTGELVFPDTLESIDYYAFAECSGFSGNLILPDSISSIESGTFSDCKGFDGNLILSKKLQSIESSTFQNCSGFVGDLTIPGNVSKVGNNAFGSCTGFNGLLKIENGVNEIEESAFKMCSKFTGDLILPDSVVKIGRYSFESCKGFNGKLVIGNGTTTIGERAFYDCIGFTGSLYLGNHVETIGDNAFSGLNGSNFTGDLVIPASVKKIGKYAFRCNKGFDGKLVLQSGLLEIGERAFISCSGFTGDLIIPNSVTSIGKYAFYGCEGFKGRLSLSNSISTIEESTFDHCRGLTGDLMIPNGVTVIGKNAFWFCDNLDGSLTIPSSVSVIDYGAFNYCEKLSGQLNIPDSVTTIGAHAFNQCQGFSGQLVIPESVTSIGSWAFESCNGFSGNLTIPSKLTLISEYTFRGCTGIKGDLTIGDSVTSIEANAFESCSFKGTLTLGSNVSSIAGNAFDSFEMNKLVIGEGRTNVNLSGINNIFFKKVYFPKTLTQIEGTLKKTSTFSDTKLKCYCYKGTYAYDWAKGQGYSVVRIGNLSQKELSNPRVSRRQVVWDCIEFGEYYQSEDDETEPIIWMVLSVDNDEALLVSEKILDYKPYSKIVDGPAWSVCNLRDWLNGNNVLNSAGEDYSLDGNNFINTAFSEDDREALIGEIMILQENDLNNEEYGLSLSEKSRCAYTSTYASSKKAGVSAGDMGAYWIAAKTEDYKTKYVGKTGSIVDDGCASTSIMGVRPVIRIDLTAADWGFYGTRKVTSNAYNALIFDMDEDGFDFDNSHYGLKLGNWLVQQFPWWPYKYPYERYREVFDSSFTKHMYEQLGNWNGSCFGMIMMAEMLNLGILNSSSYPTENISESSELGKAIARYQIFSDSALCDELTNRWCILEAGQNLSSDSISFEDLINRISGGENISIIYQTQTAHCVAVDTVRGVEESGNGWYRIPVYNPNNPTDKNKYLELNPTTNHWRIFKGDELVGYNYDESFVAESALFVFSEKLYSSLPKSFNGKERYVSSSNVGQISLSFTNEDNLIIKNHDGIKLCEFKDGECIFTAFNFSLTERKNASEEGGSKENIYKTILIPNGDYQISTKKGRVIFNGNDKYRGIVSENGFTASFSKSGEVSIESSSEITANVCMEDVDTNQEEAFLSVATDIKVGNKSTEISLDNDILSVNSPIEQNIDVSIIDQDGERTIENASSVLNDKLFLSEDAFDTFVEISFSDDGTLRDEYKRTINVNSQYGELPSIEKEGCEFVGWFTEAKGGCQVLSDSICSLKEDHCLYARFRPFGFWGVDVENGYYSGQKVVPEIEVYDDDTLLIKNVDYTVSYKNNTNAFTLAEGDDGFEAVKSKAPTITIKGKGNYSGSETLYFIIEPKSLEDEDIVMAEIGALPYSTKVQKPSPAVNWGKKKLAANKDYTISYYSSKDEGITVTDDVIMISDSATAIEPKDGGTYYVRAVGKGNYKGEIIQSFVIAGNDEKPVNKLTIGKIANKPFDNGNEIKPVVEIKDGRDKLTEGEHYTVEYRNNTDVGTASVIVTGLGKYVGTKTVNFQITGTAIKSTKITIPKSSLPYADGAPVTQDITVSMKNNPLTGIEASVYAAIENEAERRQYDYTYEYKDNIYPGKASVVFTGINGYTGTITKNFTITGINISKLQIGNLKTAYVYTGEEIEQEGLTFKLKPSAKEPEINLERDADFTIAYTNNQKAGTATMVITGVNGYTGTVKKSFKINPYPITPKDDTSDKFKVEFTDGAAVYEKSGSKPKPEVTFNGELLTEGKDYKLSYSNNSAVNDCTGTKKPTITVTGMGNFKGSDNTCIFVIEARNIGDGSVVVSAPDKVATGKKGAWKSTVTLTDTSGKKLAVGKDYLKNIEYTYEAIEGTVLDGSKKTPDAVTREIGDKVEDSDIVPAGTKIKITATGTGNYNETVEGSYRIVANDINKLTVTLNPKTYTGKAIKVSPEEITFKSGKNVLTLAEGVDYEILEDSYKNNINKGKATFEIRGLGNYGGTKKITFTIGQKGFIWWWRNLSNL